MISKSLRYIHARLLPPSEALFLPWQGLDAAKAEEERKQEQEQRTKMILDMKRNEDEETVRRSFEKSSSLFLTIFVQWRLVTNRNRYAYLRKNFRNLFLRKGFEYDNVFDWIIVWYLMMHPEEELEEEEEDIVHGNWNLFVAMWRKNGEGVWASS